MADTAMDFKDPLDFDMDDPLLAPLPVTANKRRKIIGLDDLFNEHKKEQKKGKKKKSKVSKGRKVYASDDDDANEAEHKLTAALHDFQKTIKEVDGQQVALNELDREDVNLSWGLQVFGTQKTHSPLVVPDLGGCMLLQNFGKNELSSLVDCSSGSGEDFFKGLLLNGWLSKLIMSCRYLEESIAKWTFNLLLYSSDESLMMSACEFWCAILLCSKAHEPVVKIEWLPGFAELNRALDSFGIQYRFLPDVESTHGSEESNHMDSVRKGPPINIRAWIKFLNACCQARSRYPVFSTLEAEEIVGIVVCLFLERQLLGITVALHDCLISAINFFEGNEWNNSCAKVAKSLADRVLRDSNCVRMIECISGVDTRSKQLRSSIAFEILRSCFDEEMDTEDILESLISTNLKAKSSDLFKIYLCLVLNENWLAFGEKTEPAVNELWRKFIWKCSSQISNTDFRPCAQEIRSRASYLLQSTSNN